MSGIILNSTIIFILLIVLETVFQKSRRENEKEYIHLPENYWKATNYASLILGGCAVFVLLRFGAEAVSIAILFIICMLVCKIVGLAIKRYRLTLETDYLVYSPMFGLKKRVKYEDIERLDDSLGDTLFIVVSGKKWARLDASAVGYNRAVRFLNKMGIRK